MYKIMKKLFVILFAVMAVITVSDKDTVSHDPQVLPESAKSIIKKNFKADISFIKIDKNFGRVKDYEVVMTDGSEITFDSKGNWTEVECRSNGSVPQFFVVKGISDYVAKNHSGQKIIGIDKERNGYEVTLTGGIDIKFDERGEFKHYDD